MFNFTTTTVINKNVDGDSVLFKGESGVLKVKRHNNFKKDNVMAVYKRAATDPELAEVKFNLSGLTAGFYRIALYVRLSGNNNSYYANDFVFKGKPFYIEFEVVGGENVAEKVVKIANKYMAMVYENKLLDVIADNSTSLTIKAIDEYQRITKAVLEKFNKDAGIETFRGYLGAFEQVKEASVVKAGKEGFGTYSYLIKDLRLPTAANTRFTRIIQDEAPIPGAKYNQYTLYYCVNRGVLGGDAVGEVTKSRTVHVFYVNQDVVSAFEAALTAASLSVVEVNGAVQDPVDPLEARVAKLETQSSSVVSADSDI